GDKAFDAQERVPDRLEQRGFEAVNPAKSNRKELERSAVRSIDGDICLRTSLSNFSSTGEMPLNTISGPTLF
ncbi:MAG: hypothetical protein VXW29_08740, partial [SAR324 cluster bacterium]|nr:hypothetical protein [SAR324 cluster bacterium]